MYLDRGYNHDSKRPSIYTATIGLYRDHVLRQPLPAPSPDEEPSGELVFSIFNCVIIDLINMERDGDVIDRNLIRSCVSMLEVLYESDAELVGDKLYQTSFEPAFLNNSREFYRLECQRLLQDGDAHAWLQNTRRRLLEEQDRCDMTISPLTQTKILKVVEDELVTAHLDEFLALEGSGLKAMIDSDRFEDLRILYRLISKVDASKKSLRNILKIRIVELGLEIEQVLKSTDFALVADAGEGGNDGASKVLSSTGQQTAAAIKWGQRYP